MFNLKRMNALTPIEAQIMSKLAKNEPVSPKSEVILKSKL